MNVQCPHCQAVFRVDPERIPPGGVRARCSRCGGVFPIGRTERPAGVAPGDGAAPAAPPTPAPSPAAVSASDALAHAAAAVAAPPPPAPAPGPTPVAARPAASPFRAAAPDPHTRAQRIARALVSDMVAYHPDKRERSLAAGTLRQDFRDEILKSWEEYVGQVGTELAKSTPYFRDALNDILAKGQKLF
ncbi:MAG: zinc-ribbon domain-containing protein [Gemmatimonadetes bacterium]|nr:zinc-ribbon domain-containing protein [Gemmatimonadota bacterium]